MKRSFGDLIQFRQSCCGATSLMTCCTAVAYRLSNQMVWMNQLVWLTIKKNLTVSFIDNLAHCQHKHLLSHQITSYDCFVYVHVNVSRGEIKETKAGLGLLECLVYQELQWVSLWIALPLTKTFHIHPS